MRVIERLNLTLDDAGEKALERRRKLARDYAAGRADGLALVAERKPARSKSSAMKKTERVRR